MRNKNLLLAIEFSRYVLTHPSFARKMPKRAQIILVPKNDARLRRANLLLADRIRRRHPDHAIAIIQFDGLAPVRSRLRNPRLLAA